MPVLKEEKKESTKADKVQPGFSPRSALTLLITSVGVGLLLSIVISLIRVAQNTDVRSIYLGLDGLRVPIAIGVVTVLALIGWVIWFRPKLRTVLVSLVLLIAVVAVGRRLFRIESFYGNMVPRLTWRWAPTAEEYFTTYVTSNDQATGLNKSPKAILKHTFQDHPGFLGATRDGVIRSVKIDPNWSDRKPRELWRHPVGPGWAGFAVVGQSAVTQEQRGPLETVVCYDLMSGAECWVHGDEVRFVDEHGDGPRAVPTIDNGRVFTIGATGLLNCIDAVTGKLIWQQRTLSRPDEQNILWGMCGSPLIVEDVVIVTPGGEPGQAVMAFDLETGDLAWSGGDDAAAYASPMLAEFAQSRQIISFNGAGLRGFDAADGQPLWLYPWITQGEHQRVNVAQPVFVTPAGAQDGEGYFVISSGYAMGTALLRVTASRGRWTVDEVWRSRALKSKMSNFVVHDQFIYGLDNGILTCVDLSDGARRWKRGRHGHGQILLVDNHLLIQTESGEVVLVEATPDKYRAVASLPALADKTWNNAALAANILVVRNDREAAAFELPLRD